MHATILRVNNTTGSTAPYSDLMSAYEAAAEGDTIYLEGSVTNYEGTEKHGGIILNKSISIFGPGYYLIENNITGYSQYPATIGKINADGTYGIITIRSSNIVLKGISMYGLTLVGTQNITINRCRIQRTVTLDAATANCVFHQNKMEGGLNANNASNILITNNIMAFPVSLSSSYSIRDLKSSILKYNHIRCYEIRNMENCTLENNLIEYQYIYSSDNNMMGKSNYLGDWRNECLNASTDTPIDSDYRLSDYSALATKDNGKPIGAFGGTDPYVLSGIPNIPVISDLQIPASANKDEGLTVTVKITTEK